MIEQLLTLYAKHPQVRALENAIKRGAGRCQVVVPGLQASAMPLVFAALSQRRQQTAPLLFVLGDADEAGYFYHDMAQLLGQQDVLFFPSSYRRAIKYGQRDAANEILRTEVMARLATVKEDHSVTSLPTLCIVTHPEALAELVASRQLLQQRTLQLRRGEEVDLHFVEQTLMEYGFVRTDYVYEPGQFAVRGSLVDVFSFSSEYPYRIDFFGDEVDSIRSFEVETQLSREQQEVITLVPEMSTESDGKVPFATLLPAETVLVTRDYDLVAGRIEVIAKEGLSRQATIVAAAESIPTETPSLMTAEKFHEGFDGLLKVVCPPTRSENDKGGFSITPQPIFHKNFDLVTTTFRNYMVQGYRIYVLADSVKQNDRLRAIFDEQAPDIRFIPVEKTLHEGFVDHDLKVVCFTDHQIFDRFHKYNLRSERARSGKVALSLKELQEIEIGDYVVHVDHGIGRFGGLVRMPAADGHYQEVIKISYEHEDTVFVSIHALHKVSKYKGKEGEAPRISRLGTGAWERMKDRTKTKIKDIARDLIRLYSNRRAQQGFRYSPDSYLQHELEASFLYEDTPDQLKATTDVKADMEKARPMDRLVCGDVGFGKTEVAVRAAFKAATDGKQVAVLVPTTVLAYQHYQTFSERLHDFPVRVEYLSRARTAKQTADILADLQAGKIDILIGTHKLIGKQVRFHDLGLLIIDEEQKFGVATKERLRQMKVNVDTLTLTATPIPRTLQFSLMGARDLSVIQTPPPNRYPIQTEVHEFSAEVITQAIEFEMSRNGQVFIVSNRISSLPELEELVHRHVPDARVAVGHGRMNTEELEQVVTEFAAYDYDVLISTTIIESGLDIPNANTIIICSAQNFGLSDLHQMRGRVGRSNKKAFCYLLAPPLAVLQQEARRRLQAIENFSDLGSGIHIAMQDLDIRGAGNLLGAEQSGFIADLGYETYQKILAEAVKELKNDEFQELFQQQVETGEITSGEDFVDECQFESDLQIGFPETYVPGSSERMLLYRELDALESDEAVEAFRRRMNDRFGPIPNEGQELIRVVGARRLGKYFGVERMILKNNRLRLYFVKNASSPFYQSPAFDRCLNFCMLHPTDVQLSEVQGRRSMLVRNVASVQAAYQVLLAIKGDS